MIHRLLSLLLVLLTILPAIAQTQNKSTKTIVNGITFNLPGSWKRGLDYSEGGQYGFKDSLNSLGLTISVREAKKMEFYNDSLTNFELAKTFYKWDADYWSDAEGIKVKKLQDDTTNNSIIWVMEHPQEKNVILYGVKESKLVGLTLIKYTEGNIDEDSARILLYKIFNNK
jgi:hypothetical protein